MKLWHEKSRLLMAKCSFVSMDEGTVTLLTSMGKHTDEVCMRACEEGGKVLEQYVRDELESVIGKNLVGKPRSTGELLRDLGVSAPQVDRNGNYNVKVGFYSYRGTDGKPNALIANALEYGRKLEHGDSKTTPKPFLRPAKRKGMDAVWRAMGKVFEEALKTYGTSK